MEIYAPSEDSYFLSQILRKEVPKIKDYRKLKYFEIGPGSGIQLQTLIALKIPKENISSADINPSAVKQCKKLGFQCIQSNLFSKIKKNEKFDIILFNPPYLPNDKFDKQPDTSGGKTGAETINRFLKQSKSYLGKNGTIFLLTSSYTGKINWQGFQKKLITEKSLFFEKLLVWKLTF